MNPGERQVSPDLQGIRKDHTERYKFAAEKLKGQTVIDCGCGVGYGSYIMAEAGVNVLAYDIDKEAIEYAKQHYRHKRIRHGRMSGEKIGPLKSTTAAVCFEMIEHVTNPKEVLESLRKSAQTLIASVPNELVFPYHDGILYHHRHYTPQEFEALLNSAGWEVIEWHGQEGAESEVQPNIQGRTIMAVCKAAKKPKGGKHKKLPAPPQTGPQSVAIVAMGQSAQTYMHLASQRGNRHRVADETWAINSMGNVIMHDLLFHMDDCKIQEARAEKAPGSNVWGMCQWLKQHPKFMTSKKYGDYPGAIEYPLQDVINAVGSTYLNNTVAYAVAYAIYLGVKHISLFGCDYTYKNMHKAESGRGCVEFLLGMAAARGISIEVAQDSSLLDANVDPRLRPYGYDAYDVEIKQTDKGVEVIKKEREHLPTPEEMEERYNHEPKR